MDIHADLELIAHLRGDDGDAVADDGFYGDDDDLAGSSDDGRAWEAGSDDDGCELETDDAGRVSGWGSPAVAARTSARMGSGAVYNDDNDDDDDDDDESGGEGAYAGELETDDQGRVSGWGPGSVGAVTEEVGLSFDCRGV